MMVSSQIKLNAHCRVDACPVIMLPKNFQPKEGTKLSEDLIVGKHLSSGLQVPLSSAFSLPKLSLLLHSMY